MRWKRATMISGWLLVTGVAAGACKRDAHTDSAGDGDGDVVGDGDGENTGGTNGDGDGDNTGGSGDGDGDNTEGSGGGDGDNTGGMGQGGMGGQIGMGGDSIDGTGGQTTNNGQLPGCLDTTNFSWSPLDYVEDASATDAREGAIAVDEQGRAFALLDGSTGASVNTRYVVYDPVTGWATPQALSSSLEGGTSWYPDAVTSPSGKVVASYRRQAGGGTIQLIAFQSDMLGSKGIDAIGEQGTSTLFHGGIAVSDAGTVLVGLSKTNRAYGSVDFATPEVVLEGNSGAFAASTSISPDGFGFVFAGDSEVLHAIPFAPPSSWAAPEPIHGAEYAPINGQLGVSLGGGEALAAFGSLVSGADRVQLFASFRTSDGTWSAPSRFDSGDDSSHAQLHELVAGAPGEAFALWREPDGYSLGRFEGSSEMIDALELGPIVNYWSLAAGRCGNAGFLYTTSGSTDVHIRYYRRGTGWLPEDTIETGTGTVAPETDLSFSSTGEAMALLVRNGVFYFSKFGPG